MLDAFTQAALPIAPLMRLFPRLQHAVSVDIRMRFRIQIDEDEYKNVTTLPGNCR